MMAKLLMACIQALQLTIQLCQIPFITGGVALQACTLLNFGDTTTKAGLILGWATSLAMLGYYFKRALDTSEMPALQIACWISMHTC